MRNRKGPKSTCYLPLEICTLPKTVCSLGPRTIQPADRNCEQTSAQSVTRRSVKSHFPKERVCCTEVPWGAPGRRKGKQSCAYIVDAEEAERHDVSAPLGPGAAGAAARRDPAPVKHHRHVVRALGGHHLRGHHGGTQMEACGNSQVPS